MKAIKQNSMGANNQKNTEIVLLAVLKEVLEKSMFECFLFNREHFPYPTSTWAMTKPVIICCMIGDYTIQLYRDCTKPW